jgi:hypothetical protein
MTWSSRTAANRCARNAHADGAWLCPRVKPTPASAPAGRHEKFFRPSKQIATLTVYSAAALVVFLRP